MVLGGIQQLPQGLYQKIPSLEQIYYISSSNYEARSNLSNSVLCGLYLKIPRKLPQNSLFSQ
jgi:hypothetical protein